MNITLLFTDDENKSNIQTKTSTASGGGSSTTTTSWSTSRGPRYILPLDNTLWDAILPPSWQSSVEKTSFAGWLKRKNQSWTNSAASVMIPKDVLVLFKVVTHFYIFIG